MTLSIQIHDLVIGLMAVLGTIVLFAAALAVLVRVLGRRLPEIEESVAQWLLRDAQAWRARLAKKAELANTRAVLQAVKAVEA